MKPTRTYIVPNELGLIYGAGTLLVFIEGFSQNIPFLNIAGFVLLTFFLVGLFQTNRNMAGVEMDIEESEPVPEGGKVRVRCTLRNLDSDAHFNIGIRVKGSRPVWVPILPERASVELEIASTKRGIFDFPDFKFYSIFPLGLFYAWKTCHTSKSYVVYPKPQGNRPIPQLSLGLEEFSGHRPYREGDSLRQIDWHARARGLPWMIKEFESGSVGEFILKESDLAPLPEEERLSQFSQWVLTLDRQGVHFALLMENASVPLGRGRRHLNRCFEKLAIAQAREADSP